jgi:glycosyltransferase involved in cell wall biosynthesis
MVTKDGMSVAFFDGIGTAHSLPLVAGLDGAAERAGLRRLWASALRPPGARSGSVDWVEIESFYERFCETGEFSPAEYRRTCRRAMTRAEESGASVFCDLAVSRGLPIRPKMPSVWVTHQVPHPVRADSAVQRGKRLVANPRRWSNEAKLIHERNVIRALARADGRFVVHTEPARERLRAIAPKATVQLASWPIVSETSPPALASASRDEVRAVFPGEAREGKGLDVLLSALPYIEGIDIFDLPTVVTAEAQFSVRNARDERVRMGAEWLSNADYYGRLQAASIAILPYRRAAMANAGISASLLDVLAVGLPAVITAPIARGLPAGYEGAIVVAPDSATELADGVNEALRRLDELRAAAREQGPAFVLKHHSYEQYLDALLEAGTVR